MSLADNLPFIIAGLFVLLFALEKATPLRQRTAGILARLTVNLMMSGLAFLTALIAVKPAALGALNWTGANSFGLLHWLHLPAWAACGISFLLLDLSFYYWHVANHKFSWLWRFHNVHHIDLDLDVSTGFRFHFGEVLFSTFFRAAQVALIGMPVAAFVAYELVFQANTLFHHSNLRLPIRLERLLNLVLVTPRMHGIHHSQVREETDSNYGVVFCWWDKLHRTIGLNIPQSKVQIGVAGYASPEHNRFWQAITLPFRKQRDYWRLPDGTIPRRQTADLEDRRIRLAE